MLQFFRRRGSRRLPEAVRSVVESLEGRTFFDVTTFAVNDSSVGSSYGVSNTQSGANQWTHQYTVTQNSVPDHSHTIASFQVNVQPDFGSGSGGCGGDTGCGGDSCCGGCSGGDGGGDYGWIKVKCNGSIVQDFENIDPGTIQNYAGNYGGLFHDNGAQTDAWEIDSSDNIEISVTGGGISTGTYAGFAHTVEADRGGQDGSVQMKVDGTTRGAANIYVAIPTNGLLNLGGTPDDQLPGHPYFTITGPSTMALDTADSRPDLGFNVYTLPASDTTINFHMVDPYMGGQDYQDGISVSIDALQPAANVIPMQGMWWDGNTNTFWDANAAPDAKGLYAHEHVQGEMTDARMDELVAQLNSIDHGERDSAKSALIAEIQACPSAHVISRFSDVEVATGSLGPQQIILVKSVGSEVNPFGLTYSETGGIKLAGLPSDRTHQYIIGASGNGGTMDVRLSFANGGELVRGPIEINPLTMTDISLPSVAIFPLATGTGKVKVIVDITVLQADGNWVFLGEKSMYIWFTNSNAPNQP